MNTVKTVVGFAILAASFMVSADDGFGLWRVSVGGAFNSGVSASLRTRNIPVAAPAYQVPAGMRSSKEAQKLEWDGGAYIRPDGEGDPTDPWGRTTEWRLPVGAYDGSIFTLENNYQDVVSSAHGESGSWDSSDPMQFGISIEASRTLWESDRATCGRWGHWGVDFAAAFSYFFQRDVYSASGSSWRTDKVESGRYRTVVDPEDALDDYFPPESAEPAQSGFYGGYKDTTRTPNSLRWGAIGTPTLVGAPLRTTYASGTASYNASGDYRELEMLFMARPWYEIFDWWRVFGEVGLGVSWGCYSHDFAMALMDGSHRSSSEDFDDWSVYGVAGLGTIFRLWDFDLSVDFLARFLRDDVDVNGRYVQGEIERSNWMFRVMLGYEF